MIVKNISETTGLSLPELDIIELIEIKFPLSQLWNDKTGLQNKGD